MNLNEPAELREGTVAPDFEGMTQRGEPLRLSAWRGRWVVLFFYPKDYTPMCTLEVCRFRDAWPALHQAGAELVGVNLESTRQHQRFARTFRLPFTLVADRDGAIARAYGALWEWRFLGLRLRSPRRRTFLLDGEGVIRRIWTRIRVPLHAQEVLAELKRLRDAPGQP